MRDNAGMTTSPPPQGAVDDQHAAEALSGADPADAPDIADGIASGLQRELDRTGTPRQDTAEPSS
jgi:hypothetical protein